MSRTTPSLFIAAAVLALTAGCGGSDGTADEPAGDTPAASSTPAEDLGPAPTEATDDVDAGEGVSDPPAAPSGGGTGTVVLDGEVIEMTEIRCHLETQPAAAGGGNIEFVVQGSGTNAAGEPVMIDISRYDEDSSFAGDDVQIYVGDIMTDEARELHSKTPVGTVTLAGSTATVDDLAVQDLGAFTEHAVSIDITCR